MRRIAEIDSLWGHVQKPAFGDFSIHLKAEQVLQHSDSKTASSLDLH